MNIRQIEDKEWIEEQQAFIDGVSVADINRELVDFSTSTFTANSRFRAEASIEFRSMPTRVKIGYWPRMAGKTETLIRCVLDEVEASPGLRVVYITLNRELSSDVYRRLMRGVSLSSADVLRMTTSPYLIQLMAGTRIDIVECDRLTSSVVGVAPDLIVLDELQYMNPELINDCVLPMMTTRDTTKLIALTSRNNIITDDIINTNGAFVQDEY